MDSLLRIVYMDTRFFIQNEEVQNEINHDRRLLYRNKENIELFFYQKDQLLDKKTFHYTDNTAIVEIMNIFLQVLLLKEIKKNFHCNLIISGMKLSIDMNFTLYEINDFRSISPKFSFPEQINKINSSDGFYVYKMHVAGFLGLFIRTNWYMAFSRKFPYPFVTYWGGGKKDYELYYVNSSPEAIFNQTSLLSPPPALYSIKD